MRAPLTRRIVSTLFAIVVCLLLACVLVVQVRYVGTKLGILPTTQVDLSTIDAPYVLSDGSVVAQYCSEAVTTSGFENLTGRTSTTVRFDDAWFTHDSHIYQHELATTCAVLTAVCNSESQYYSNVEGSLPYAEQTLTALGFSDIRTESYALRSNILDELGSLFAGSCGGAAYTFASKTLSKTGTSTPETLIFVGIRGSYGTEWLSNFNLADTASGGVDHFGFGVAEDEVQHALTTYAHDIGADPQHTSILITGHSRGGAIANLLAARLNNARDTSQALAPAANIYAYTFAAPGVTRTPQRENETYGNIYNIVNEADIVPQLPLATWGYGRYGTTVTLPSVAADDFETSYESMSTAFRHNTGVELNCDKNTLAALDNFEGRAARALPSSDNLASPLGLVGIVQALIGVDIPTALTAHYPDTYIAWMQSVEGAHLSFS